MAIWMTEGVLFAQPTQNSQLEPVRVELTNDDHLLVSRHDMVHETILAYNEIYNERIINLERGEAGFGFSIQGGNDFKAPIKVFKVFKGSSAEQSGVKEKDIVMAVNGVSLWGKTHEEASLVVKNAGNRVSIKFGKLREFDTEQERAVTDQWLEMANISLNMASVTHYQLGTAIPKPNQIQVTSKDGLSKVTLHCHDDGTQYLTECLEQIERRINQLTKLQVDNYNADAGVNDQVLLMGWVSEYLPSAANLKVWQRKYLALKKFQLLLYNTPPEEVSGWERPEKCYKLLEISVQVMQPHSFQEQRANAVVITTGYGTNHIISFEKQKNLQLWTQCIHDTTVQAVLSIERQQFSAQWRDQYVYFLLDIQRGFVVCSRENLSNCLWNKPFSDLRRSTDDGHSKLRLEFMALHSTEVQELKLEDMQVAVCCMECFLTAKVASLDPNFASELDIVV